MLLKHLLVLVHSRVVQLAWSNLGWDLIYCGLALHRGRNVGRLTEERQLKLIALVHMSVNSSQDGSNLFIQSSKYMKCAGALAWWDAGKCDSSFFSMTHRRQDARRTQNGLFGILITI